MNVQKLINENINFEMIVVSMSAPFVKIEKKARLVGSNAANLSFSANWFVLLKNLDAIYILNLS